MDSYLPGNMENPIFAVAGQTRRLTFGEQPKPSLPPRVPTRIKSLIAELGLRYRPTSQADLEAHAGALALLCTDLADSPPHLLERAIKHHALNSPYLPKAADLVKLMQGFLNDAKPAAQTGRKLDQAARANERLAMEDPDFPARWQYDAGGALQLVPIADYRASISPQAEAAE